MEDTEKTNPWKLVNRQEAAFLKEEIGTRFKRGKIERVLFVHPPDVSGTSSLFTLELAKGRTITNHPAYGLGVLASQLRRLDITPRIINLNHHVLKEAHKAKDMSEFDYNDILRDRIKKDISDFSPDLIGVTCTFTLMHEGFAEICRFIRQSFPDIPIAVGGVHVSGSLERVIKDIPAADFIFIRESDVSFPRFTEIINGKRGIDDLCQIIIKTKDGYFRIDNEHIPSPDEFDIIPAYDLMEIADLSKVGRISSFGSLLPNDLKNATVQSNRGCRGRCAYCSVRNFNGPGVRQRPVKSVVDELEVLEKEYGINHVTWIDDDLLFNHARAIELFKEKTKRRLKLTWDAGAGVIAASCTDDVMKAAEESGCIGLYIGLESGSKRILSLIRKPASPDIFFKASDVMHRNSRIWFGAFVMIGFPTETYKDIQDTLNVCRKMDIDWCRINNLQPFPNTEIYKLLAAEDPLFEVKTNEVRMTLGSFGKQREIEDGVRKADAFRDPFNSLSLSDVPDQKALQDIWFIMNYKLNFERIPNERRPEKIKLLIARLETILAEISPHNAFAMYFLCHLQEKMNGRMSPDLFSRLNETLAGSDYWRSRFKAFGLSMDKITDKNPIAEGRVQ